MAQQTPPLRPFGRAAEDLELDFGSGDRPALVTALLTACAGPADSAHWWQQPVGERTAALLALLSQSEAVEGITLMMACEAADCMARFEIDLPHAAFSGLRSTAETIEVRRDDGEVFLLRRPTGADLNAWRAFSPSDREAASFDMLACLRLSGEPRTEDVTRAAEALADADPLVAFSVLCACPHCGHEEEREVDLEGLALQRFAARQRGLLHEVHALASRYGWTESEVFAVAPARRARYLELIEGTPA